MVYVRFEYKEKTFVDLRVNVRCASQHDLSFHVGVWCHFFILLRNPFFCCSGWVFKLSIEIVKDGLAWFRAVQDCEGVCRFMTKHSL